MRAVGKDLPTRGLQRIRRVAGEGVETFLIEAVHHPGPSGKGDGGSEELSVRGVHPEEDE